MPKKQTKRRARKEKPELPVVSCELHRGPLGTWTIQTSCRNGKTRSGNVTGNVDFPQAVGLMPDILRDCLNRAFLTEL